MVTVLRDDYLYNSLQNAGGYLSDAIIKMAMANKDNQQNQQMSQDYQNLLQSSMQGMNSVPVGMQGLVNLQSPQLQQAMIPQLMQNIMPKQPNLLEAAQVQNYLSQIQERQYNMNKPEPLSPLNVGGKLGFADKQGNVRVTEMKYGDPETQSYQAINSGDKLLLFNPKTGDMTPTEYQSSKVPSTNVTLQNLPASATSDIVGWESISKSLDELKPLLEQTKSITGPGRELLTQVQSKYGSVPFVGDVLGKPAKGTIEFQTSQKMFSDVLARLQSGAALNEAEVELYFNQYVPRLDLPYETNIRRLESFKSLAKNLMETRKGSYRGLGYNVPESKKDDPLGIR